MSKVRLYGGTSGYVDLAAPDVAPDATLTLPSTFGGIGSNVVSTTKTDAFSSSGTGFETVTGLSAAITPTSASSKILVVATVTVSASQANTMVLNIDRGGSPITEGTVGTSVNGQLIARINTGDDVLQMSAVYLDSPSTTSSVTYQVKLRRGSGGTMYVNRPGDNTLYGAVSNITAIEVAA